MCVFSRFLNCTNGTKSRRVSHRSTGKNGLKVKEHFVNLIAVVYLYEVPNPTSPIGRVMLRFYIKNVNNNFSLFYSLIFSLWPSYYLLVPSQQWKQQNNVWNLFKFNNKDFRMTLLTSFWCLYCYLWTDFTPNYSDISIVDFDKQMLTGEQDSVLKPFVPSPDVKWNKSRLKSLTILYNVSTKY